MCVWGGGGGAFDVAASYKASEIVRDGNVRLTTVHRHHLFSFLRREKTDPEREGRGEERDRERGGGRGRGGGGREREGRGDASESEKKHHPHTSYA